MKKLISFLLFAVILSFVFCSGYLYRSKKVVPFPPSKPTGPKRWAYGYTKIEYGLAVNHLGDTIPIKEFNEYGR